MAGKQDVVDIFVKSTTTTTGQDSSSSKSSSSNKIKIPVVMVQHDHGKQILHTQSKYQNEDTISEDSSIQIKLETEEHNLLLLSSFLGNTIYPKVWISTEIMFIQLQAPWAAFFQNQVIPTSPPSSSSSSQSSSSSKGGNPSPDSSSWQLYLISLRDGLRLLPALPIRTKTNLKAMTTTTLMLSKAKIYYHTVRRKCPKHIVTMDALGRVVLKR
jgi:hypothetical protein